MSQIPFSVSARTALLIGQQNFTNAEGAIIELVKNAYDADSEYCLVIFDVPFYGVPPVLTTEMVSTYRLESLIRDGYYVAKNGRYQLMEEIDEPSVSIIRQAFVIGNYNYTDIGK